MYAISLVQRDRPPRSTTTIRARGRLPKHMFLLAKPSVRDWNPRVRRVAVGHRLVCDAEETGSRELLGRFLQKIEPVWAGRSQPRHALHDGVELSSGLLGVVSFEENPLLLNPALQIDDI